MVKIAGFFRELWPSGFGVSDESIGNAKTDSPLADEDAVVQYLLGGEEIVSVMSVTEDVLGSGERILGGDSILTDGEWIWRADLRFYVNRYHVELPEDFLSRIRGSGYTVPPVPDRKMDELTQFAMDVL